MSINSCDNASVPASNIGSGSSDIETNSSVSIISARSLSTQAEILSPTYHGKRKKVDPECRSADEIVSPYADDKPTMPLLKQNVESQQQAVEKLIMKTLIECSVSKFIQFLEPKTRFIFIYICI